MTMVIDGTNGVTFPNTTVQTVAALPLTGGQLSGNLTFASGTNGIIFNNSSATTNSTLNDYETGTFTPIDNSGASLSFTTNYAYYTKIGNMVYCSAAVTYPSTSNTNGTIIGGLPFSSSSSAQVYGGFTRYTTYSSLINLLINSPYAQVFLYVLNSQLTNANMSGKRIDFVVTYQAQF